MAFYCNQYKQWDQQNTSSDSSISAKERSHARYEVKKTTLHNAAKKKGSSIVSSNGSNALDQSNRDPVIKLIIRKKTYFSADRGICQL